VIRRFPVPGAITLTLYSFSRIFSSFQNAYNISLHKPDAGKGIMHRYSERLSRTAANIGGIILCSFVGLTLLSALTIAQDMLPETQKVFGKYSDRVLKIQVVEKSSGAKAVIGSGFFVNPDGRIITNYHVISKLVLHSERYRAELVESDGAIRLLSLLAIDVINDLALVSADVKNVPFFTITAQPLQQGTRIYSMGFPHDIGISIVEGTYNGLMEHTLYEKIHFTAPLNPGMSGGPAINAPGEVVGVNVSSMGEEVSFLVPSKAVIKLMNSAGAERKVPNDFLEDIRRQIMAHQTLFYTANFMRSGKAVQIGEYSLPSELSPLFRCWGDSEHPEKLPYHTVDHTCSTDDAIYISDEQSSGSIQFSHRYITNRGLNRFRFSNLYSDFFAGLKNGMGGNEEEVTNYVCKSGTVRRGTMTLKTAFCVRGYRKLKGLYDVALKAAVIGSDSQGLQTELEISGVSFEKAVELTKGYLERIKWAK
jgi:serine protease Do